MDDSIDTWDLVHEILMAAEEAHVPCTHEEAEEEARRVLEKLVKQQGTEK